MKHELFSMMEHVNTIVNRYKLRILQNNVDDELDILRDEVEYFKFEALNQFN